MSLLPPEDVPKDLQAAGLQEEARATLDAYAALLKNPAFMHNLDLAVLTKIAGDENVPHRERLRAAEVLAKIRLQAMEALAELSAVRAQVLHELGLEEGPKTVAMTQVNQRIEIVRVDDWRADPTRVVEATLEEPKATEAPDEPAAAS